jgi:hypothetical protein
MRRTPAFLAAQAAEAQARLEAYLPWAAPLLGRPVGTLTWRQAIELTRAGNAFFTAAEPAAADVYQVLWRLNPAFRRPDGSWPNLVPSMIAQGARRPGPLVSFLQERACRHVARALSPTAVEPEIRTRLNAAFQDAPGAGKSAQAEPTSPLRAALTWYDYVASEFALAGHSQAACLDYGVAWTFQVLRVPDILEGHEERYTPPSHALIGPPPRPPGEEPGTLG